MAKPMSDAIKNRAAGLKPFPGPAEAQGRDRPAVWHGLGLDSSLRADATSSEGPAPGRDVRASKGIPGPGVQEKIQDKPRDRKLKSRV